MRELLKVTPPVGWEPRTAVSIQVNLPLKAANPASHWYDRLLHRSEPTLFQRCLALHIINASKTGALH